MTTPPETTISRVRALLQNSAPNSAIKLSRETVEQLLDAADRDDDIGKEQDNGLC